MRNKTFGYIFLSTTLLKEITFQVPNLIKNALVLYFQFYRLVIRSLKGNVFERSFIRFYLMRYSKIKFCQAN